MHRRLGRSSDPAASRFGRTRTAPRARNHRRAGAVGPGSVRPRRPGSSSASWWARPASWPWSAAAGVEAAVTKSLLSAFQCAAPSSDAAATRLQTLSEREDRDIEVADLEEEK